MWQISFLVPEKAANLFESSIEPFVEAISRKRQFNNWLIRAYTTTVSKPQFLETIVYEAATLANISRPNLTIELTPNTDWVVESIRGLNPILIGRFMIYGSYNGKPKNQKLIPIQVDAGEAFGTGHHGSTKGCLLALSAMRKPDIKTRMLDLGCGAGILAIAAAKLWRIKPVASDIDHTAVRVTEENSRTNKVHRSVQCLAGNGFKSIKLRKAGPFDLVVANILSEPLRRLAKPMRAHSKPGATIILSGLLDHQSRQVLSTYRTQGFKLLSSYSIDGWTTLVLTRNKSAPRS
ncbi:MAG: 50S ribosomal protein L11 methyltransferase [Pseudomonadota bacterium]|nr:50S ribosomal protein L11 methyltransferase [Pseudomonadota bacterium]